MKVHVHCCIPLQKISFIFWSCLLNVNERTILEQKGYIHCWTYSYNVYKYLLYLSEILMLKHSVYVYV